jgi:hypothetical protein
MPTAQRTPIMASAERMVSPSMRPRATAVARATGMAPRSGSIPRKKQTPMPPKAAWLMPSLMKASRLTTTKVPMTPQSTLASTPASTAFCTNS